MHDDVLLDADVSHVRLRQDRLQPALPGNGTASNTCEGSPASADPRPSRHKLQDAFALIARERIDVYKRCDSWGAVGALLPKDAPSDDWDSCIVNLVNRPFGQSGNPCLNGSAVQG